MGYFVGYNSFLRINRPTLLLSFLLSVCGNTKSEGSDNYEDYEELEELEESQPRQKRSPQEKDDLADEVDEFL